MQHVVLSMEFGAARMEWKALEPLDLIGWGAIKNLKASHDEGSSDT